MTKAVKKKNNKKSNRQDKTLIATFVFLIITVIVLVVVALNMDSLTANKSSDMIIPILGENSKNEIIVDVSELEGKEQKEYVFAITNYKDYDINDKDVDYDINITSPETLKVKLYKNKDDKNILDQNLKTKGNKLSSKGKIKDTYKLVIDGKNISENNDKIVIEINS